MISNTSTHRLEDRGVRGGRRTPHSSGALRKDVRARKALGFTLIEVMIVVVVLSIVATIAFVGIGQNRFEGKYREFTGEIIGLITTARNRAIDDQTLVQVRVYEDKVLVFDGSGGRGRVTSNGAVQEPDGIATVVVPKDTCPSPK